IKESHRWYTLGEHGWYTLGEHGWYTLGEYGLVHFGRLLTVIDLLSDHTELFKQFSDNPSFKKWLSETIFAATYAESA
ncbi:MAG: hypothetical protein H7837_07920, partial [Magnetococcus sp. MYC-9]